MTWPEQGDGRVPRKWGPQSCHREGPHSARRPREVLFPGFSRRGRHPGVAGVSSCDPEQRAGCAALRCDPQICGLSRGPC